MRKTDNRDEQIVFFRKSKHKTALYFLLYTAVFACLLLLVFVDFIRFDRSLLWRSDGVSQYYPRAVYFANYIRTLLSGILRGNFTLPMYDFSLGMGSEVTYSLEPLYFLFALFGADHVEAVYTAQVLIRFYLAGISASILFLYFKKGYFPTFLGSVVYVFGGFALFGGARHTMFMIPMILMPLMIIAIEEILREKRWWLCPILVALSLFCNYYYLYMNTIGLGIYFLVRFFCQTDPEKKTVRNFFAKGFTIAGTYLLGVGMSCIVLATTFGQYVGSGRNGAAVIKTPNLFFYSADWLIRCFQTFLTTANSPGNWMKFGFLPIAYLAVIFLFLRKGRKELKILSVIGAVLVMLPLSGFVFSGFSSVINRWCYLLALLVAFIVAECYNDMMQMTKKERWICAGWVGVYVVLAYSGHFVSTRFVRIAAICLVVTFLLVLFCQQSNRICRRTVKQVFMVFLTGVLVFVNGHTLFSMDGTVKEYVEAGTARDQAGDTPLAAVDELEDDSFYRVATPKLNYWSICASMLYGYKGTTFFYSTLNGAILEYLEAMGSTGYSVIQLYGMNNRTYMDALAAVKYYANYGAEPACALPYGYEEKLRTEVNGKEAVFWENTNALPLGYTYDEDAVISREELEAYDVVERQEVLMQNVMLESATEQSGATAEITGSQLEVTEAAENGITLDAHAMTAEKVKMDGQDPASLTLSFQGEANAETYVLLRGANLKGNMSEKSIKLGFYTDGNAVTYNFRPDDDRYGTGQDNYVFNLGYHTEPITSCTVTMGDAGTIDFDSLEIWSLPMDQAKSYVDARTETVLEDVEIGTNQITGTVSSSERKVLVLSIPYQNGWMALVDGEPVTIERANYMYMALHLDPGEHTIELRFAIPGVKYALVIMPASVAVFAALCLISYKKRKKSNEIQER